MAERGFITDAQFDQIAASIPAEQSLNVPRATPSPAPVSREVQAAVQPSQDMHLHHNASPPSYQAAQEHMPPPIQAAPAHREVGHAVALWAYNTPDARDLNFAAGDHISVKEFVNPEWWMGKNCRTGEEGIFPSNYIRSENHPSPLAAQAAPSPAPQQHFFGDHKGYPGQQMQQPYQPYQAPPPQDPYQSHVPPVAISEQHSQTAEEEKKSGKMGDMGKKFGSKLGNAAIFGAGASIGGNIVNSIF